jgi:hypothetical protein
LAQAIHAVAITNRPAQSSQVSHGSAAPERAVEAESVKEHAAREVGVPGDLAGCIDGVADAVVPAEGAEVHDVTRRRPAGRCGQQAGAHGKQRRGNLKLRVVFAVHLLPPEPRAITRAQL